MAWYLYLISGVWLAAGVCAILYTAGARQLARKVLQDANPTLIGVVPIIGGMLLVLSISATTHPWITGIIGTLGMIKGGLMVSNPRNWYTQASHWYLYEISDQTHRLFGIISLIFGIAMASWIK